MPHTYTLTPEEENTAGRLVAEGRFANLDDVVRAGIGLVAEREENFGYTVEELRALIAEADESPLLTEEETQAAFAALKAKYAAMVRERA
jgi:putative addiction module CopG family antidote